MFRSWADDEIGPQENAMKNKAGEFGGFGGYRTWVLIVFAVVGFWGSLVSLAAFPAALIIGALLGSVFYNVTREYCPAGFWRFIFWAGAGLFLGGLVVWILYGFAFGWTRALILAPMCSLCLAAGAFLARAYYRIRKALRAARSTRSTPTFC